MSSSQALWSALVARGLGELVKSVCARHHVLQDDLLKGTTLKAVARARDELCATLYGKSYRFSLHEIGRMVGRDHSSVLSAIRRHEQRERRVA